MRTPEEIEKSILKQDRKVARMELELQELLPLSGRGKKIYDAESAADCILTTKHTMSECMMLLALALDLGYCECTFDARTWHCNKV